MIYLHKRTTNENKNGKGRLEHVQLLWTNDPTGHGDYPLSMSVAGTDYNMLEFNFQRPRHESDPPEPAYELRVSHDMLREMVEAAQKVGFVLYKES